MIFYHQKQQAFYLETASASYVMRILPDGTLQHSYYGARIPHEDLGYLDIPADRAFSPQSRSGDVRRSADVILQEYPTRGRGDFRVPAVVVETPDGRRVNELSYRSHRILSGKPRIAGLPQLDVDTDGLQTLEIILADDVSGFEVRLSYTPFEAEDVIARHAEIVNLGEQPLRLLQAASASIDFEASDFDIITLPGAWGTERRIARRPLCQGTVSAESRRGSSSHHMNPFTALTAHTATEDSGEVYGFALVYSADFKIQAEVDQTDTVRLQIGVNPETFTWLLQPGAAFTTPEALLTYSGCGLNGMSQHFHAVCRGHLGRSADCMLPRPLLLNSWEAMYFDLNDEKLKRLIGDCRGLGIDTFVLDDGWFGHRDNDRSSLGDWFVDTKKFPNGLDGVINACHENGMKFGIWFEPEMISRDSELFREHPDWCIHAPGREPLESRNQLVLDMSRPEVVDRIYEMMHEMLTRYDISYIKWDMNRNITDNGSDSLAPERQGEHAHRYILGVYALMDRLCKNHPDVFFEGCSGGGGRFDFGILYYMPQIWTSDDTDAAERMKIQYGTSLVYPPSAMTAHVSACPNHQTGRTSSFETRGAVAQMCRFGYELNVGNLSDDERAQVSRQIAHYRTQEPLVSDGIYYRLRSPFEGNVCAWQLVSPDRSRAAVMVACTVATVNIRKEILHLRGLDPDRRYRVEPLGITLSGAALMHAGLPARLTRDYASVTFDLTAE